MNKLTVSRRGLLHSAAAMATISALGIRPEQVLGAEGGILHVREVNDLQVLDPGYMIGNAEASVLYACMPRLADPVLDANGVWGWQPSEYVEKVGQDDDTHISFTLKRGLKWSDGLGELSAADVKYSLERMPKTDWGLRWPTLDHVDVTDQYSGTIVLKSPFVAIWLVGIASESGTILPKLAMEKLKDQKFTTQLPGQLGSYTMTEWVPKQRVVLKANPAWNGSKPAFAEVRFIDVEESKAAELAFETGELDITSVTPETASRYRKTPPARSKLMELPGHQYTWLGMNTEHPKLKDIRVRKAIQRAIDVDSIIAGAYGGISVKAYGVVPVGVLGHRTSSVYSYNPEEARALLKEAGVHDLSLEVKTLSGQPERLAACEIIKANLADVGVTVNIAPVDSGPFWNLGLESKGDAWKSLELWVMRFGASPDPADATQWFTKSQIGIWNWERWWDPEFESLTKEGIVERDNGKRTQIYLRMQEIMENTGAYVWITLDPQFYICRDTILPYFEPGGDVRVERFDSA